MGLIPLPSLDDVAQIKDPQQKLDALLNTVGILIKELSEINGYITTKNVKELHAKVIKAGTIEAEQIAADAITADKIAANAVTASKIQADAVTSDKIAANAVTASEIAAGAVTAGKISVAQLSAIAADLGTITAGLLQAITIVGSTITGTLIRTSDTYPYTEMNALGDFLGAYKDALNYLLVTPDYSGNPVLSATYNGNVKGTIFANVNGLIVSAPGNAIVAASGDIRLSTISGNVLVPNWGQVYGEGNLQTLQQALDNKANKTAVSKTVYVAATSGGAATTPLVITNGVVTA